MFHLNNLNTLNGVDEFTRLVVDAHLSAKSARVVVGDRGVLGLEVHVKALLNQELRGVHDLDVLEFVITGKGSETLSTGRDQGVDAGLVDLALVVGLELLKDFIQSLPLLVVATALEEVSTEVSHIGAHLLKQGEGSRCCISKVHRALVDVREDHLLVEVVNASWVVSNIGGDGVVFGGDEVVIGCFFSLGVQDRLENRVRDFCLRTANDERTADIDVGVVVDELRTSVGTSRTGQTRVQRDTVVFVVPRVVDDVEFVAAVEQANRTGVVAQVAAVALVHLELIATGHVSQQHEHKGTKGHTGDEHGVGQLGVKRLRVLVVGWVLDVGESRTAKGHFLGVAQVDRVAGQSSRSVLVPHQQRLVAGDAEGGLGGDAVVESKSTTDDHVVGVIVRAHGHLDGCTLAVGEGNQLFA